MISTEKEKGSHYTWGSQGGRGRGSSTPGMSHARCSIYSRLFYLIADGPSGLEASHPRLEFTSSLFYLTGLTAALKPELGGKEVCFDSP
jgi:hypothetical protein